MTTDLLFRALVCALAAAWPLWSISAERTAEAWPVISLPESVQAFEIGDKVSVQGVPVRMVGFVSNLPMTEVARVMRDRLGTPLVENRVAHQLILGRAQGAFYISVQIEPAGTGSRGIVATSDLRSAQDQQQRAEQAQRRWLSRLPAGTRLIGQTQSIDGETSSYQWIFANSSPNELNAERLTAALSQDGLRLKHDSTTAGERSRSPGRVLVFQGEGKESMATLHRDVSGESILVLNFVVTSERMR